MASPFRVFRKYLKPLMVVFGVMIMFVFVILDPMAAYLGGSGGGGRGDPAADADAVAVSWEGGSLTNNELNDLVMRRRILNSFLLGVERAGALSALEAGADPRDLQNAPVVQLRGPGTPQEGVEQSVLQTRLFAQAARDAGMRVSDEAIVSYLDALGRNRVNRDDMRAMLGQLPGGARVSINYIFDALRDQMLANNFLTGYQFAFETVTPHQRYKDWLQLNDRVVVEAAAIPVQSFVVDVPQPKDAQLTAFFNKPDANGIIYKEREPQPDFVGPIELPSPTPGFRIPRKIDVQFIEANFDEYLAQAESQVSEEEILKYYEENKDPRFIKADTTLFDDSSTSQPSDDQSGSATDSSAQEATEPADATAPTDDEGGATETQSEDTENQPTDLPTSDGAQSDATDSESSQDAVPPSDNQSAGSDDANESTEGTESSTDEAPNEAAPAADDQSLRIMGNGPFGLAALLQQPATNDQTTDDSNERSTNEPAGDAPQSTADTQSPAGNDQTGVNEPADAASQPSTPPTDGAAASTRPATQPASTDAQQNAGATDSATSTAAEEPPKEFQPLDEVRDEIRRDIARARVTEQLSDLMNRLHSEVNGEFNQYYSARLDAEAQEREAPAPPPELADLASLAQEHGLKHGRTGAMSWLEFRETPIGKSGDVESQFDLWRILFFGRDEHDLYQPISTQDIDGNRFVASKTSDTPGRVPDLKEVREEVVQAWKRVKAADLALEHAKAEAKKAQDVRSPLTDYFANQPGIEVTTTDPFSRYTGGEVGVVNNQLQREPLRLSQPDGVIAAGPEFMDKVLALKDGEVGAVLNHDHSIAYVVRIAQHQMSPEELRTAYLSEAAYWPGMEIMTSDHFRRGLQLLAADIQKGANIDWKRPADEIQEEAEE
jgi:hypothetical protein